VLSLKHELKSSFGDEFVYETALSAEEALDVIGEMEVEGISLILVISDWLMPGIKGDEFLRRVKVEHPGVQTILVTGQADERTIESLVRDKVVDGLVMKPWRAKALIAEIERCIAAF
jgi:DNA-binding NtrC family response regulator